MRAAFSFMHFDAHTLTVRLHAADGESFGEALVDAVASGEEVLEITFSEGTRRAWGDASLTLHVLRELGWCAAGRWVQEI